jgi:hypothetical protein
VLAYLSRYTHRVAISNSRLLACDGDGVAFKYKAAYQPICPPCRRALFLLCSLCWMRGA